MYRTTPHTPISSKDNDTIKYLHFLSEPRHRKKEQAFLIEGIKMVEEALRGNAGVKMVVAAPPLVPHHGKGVVELAESKGIGILWITERLMDQLSESKTPQPVMAVVPIRQYTEEVLISDQAGLIVLAHRLQDPGNLGTIIRTAEAVGASGVAITPNTVDPYNAKAVRASMGSILRLPVVPARDISEFIRKCKEEGFQIAAMDLAGETSHFDADLTKSTVVILGQEGAGLPPELQAPVDLRVRIPLAKTIDSLNVATAAAVILYEAMRQRIRK
jgi:RNA methyltransferase, TrmH family